MQESIIVVLSVLEESYLEANYMGPYLLAVSFKGVAINGKPREGFYDGIRVR